MLETVLEQVLLRFLAPYVVGISRDSLRVGVFRGLLELQNLRLKPDALALLGYTTLRVVGTGVPAAVPFSLAVLGLERIGGDVGLCDQSARALRRSGPSRESSVAGHRCFSCLECRLAGCRRFGGSSGSCSS